MPAMRQLLTLLLSICVPLCSFAQGGTTALLVKDITPQALLAMLGNVVVIDVNEADNYAFAHVPGAKLLAYDAITASDLPLDLAKALVFYCWSPECPAASMAAARALELGHTNVYCMHAGITGWEDAGLPTEP